MVSVNIEKLSPEIGEKLPIDIYSGNYVFTLRLDQLKRQPLILLIQKSKKISIKNSLNFQV